MIAEKNLLIPNLMMVSLFVLSIGFFPPAKGESSTVTLHNTCSHTAFPYKITLYRDTSYSCMSSGIYTSTKTVKKKGVYSWSGLDGSCKYYFCGVDNVFNCSKSEQPPYTFELKSEKKWDIEWCKLVPAL